MRKALTDAQILARVKRGFGQGHGADYKPWLTPRDVPSKGWTSRQPGHKIARNHTVFSEGERCVLLLGEWIPRVRDIREQYPLDRSETLTIAKLIGVRHPHVHGTPIVMTTDFLLTLEVPEGTVEMALQVKPQQELEKEEVINKLEIDRIYWERRDVSWGIIAREDVVCALTQNIAWAMERWTPNFGGIHEDDIPSLERELYQIISSKEELSLWRACRYADQTLGLRRGASLSVVRHAIAHRRWIVRMDKEIRTTQPLRNIRISSDPNSRKEE